MNEKPIDEKVERIKILLEGMNFQKLYFEVKPVLDEVILWQIRKHIYLWIVGGMNDREIEMKLENDYHLNHGCFTFINDKKEFKDYLSDAYKYRQEFLNK